MKKILFAVIGVLLAATTLTGCGGNNTYNPNLKGAAQIVVTVSPGTLSILRDTSSTFTATVTGTTNTSVTWSVISHSGENGTIDQTGRYTSPENEFTVETVRATSVADPTKHGDAIVNVESGNLTGHIQ